MFEEISKDDSHSDCALTENILNLYNSAGVKNDYEALTIIFHAFMLESGFIPKDGSDADNFNYMPKNWKNSGILKIVYQHKCCHIFMCSMTCVPMYNTLSVHGVLCDMDCLESVKVKIGICKYLKKTRDFSSAFKTFDNCSVLSRYFKDNFCLPLLNLLHENSSDLPQYGFPGLIDEMKICILELLPVETVVSISAVNKNFYRLANSPYLWKQMYLRDFGKDGVPDVDTKSDETNWKQIYQAEYAKKRRKLEPQPFSFYPYRLPHIFPVGPDFDIDIGIGFNPPPPQFFPIRDPYNQLPPSHRFIFRT